MTADRLKLFLTACIASSTFCIESGNAGDISGTWSGELKSGEDTLPVTIKFAANGNPVYSYQAKSGESEVELTESAQGWRFLAPGGGVTSISVESLSVAPDRVNYVLFIAHEQTSGAILDQTFTKLGADFSLAGALLQTVFAISSNTTASQPGFMIPGETEETVYQGTLKR